MCLPDSCSVIYPYLIFPVPKVPLGKGCSKGDICADTNADCEGGSCRCRQGYSKDGNICCKYKCTASGVPHSGTIPTDGQITRVYTEDAGLEITAESAVTLRT